MDSSQFNLDSLIQNFVAENFEYYLHDSIIASPLLLLFIIYLIKYFIGNELNSKSAVEFILEFPIDFGFIGTTFVIAYLFVDSEMVDYGINMILVCIIFAIFSSLLRRRALNEYYKENSVKRSWIFWILGFVNLVFSIIFVLCILHSIK